MSIYMSGYIYILELHFLFFIFILIFNILAFGKNGDLFLASLEGNGLAIKKPN